MTDDSQAARVGEVSRRTNETDIAVRINLDGTGKADIATGIGFFDHMLNSMARHGFFDLHLKADGDLEVDGHHTVEDAGLCLGAGLHQALQRRSGFARFGQAAVPMDDALVLAAVDLSGRPFLGYQLHFQGARTGDFELCLVKEFFRAFATAGRFNLHLVQLAGENDHHIAEAAFKACGRALAGAVALSSRVKGVPSTKGKLGEDWD